MALNRLTADPALRDWLEWPVNRFDILPEGALFFACRGTGWDRQQLLRALLLGVMAVPGVRLVVHGFPWKGFDTVHLGDHGRIIISNGPLLPDSARVLTGSSPSTAAKLAAFVLNGNPLLAENLEILPSPEAILVSQDDIASISWAKKGKF